MFISSMTIVFSSSSPKTLKQDIFGPKTKDFHFLTKLCFSKNLTALLSNMTIDFSNSSPKTPKQSNFCSKFFIKNSRVLISKMTTVVFKFQPKKTQILHFLLKFRSSFFLRETLRELKFTYLNLIINL